MTSLKVILEHMQAWIGSMEDYLNDLVREEMDEDHEQIIDSEEWDVVKKMIGALDVGMG